MALAYPPIPIHAAMLQGFTTVVIYTSVVAVVSATTYSLLLPLSTTEDVTVLGELTNGAKLEVLFKDMDQRG